jgi:parvulin-like peptidyl-prolyl isomerase
MKPTRRSIGALCAFFVVAAAAVGCGGDNVPGNAVATVDGTTITRSDFDHWMTVFAKSSASQAQQGGSSTTTSTVPDPPDYVACVKAKRQAAAKTKSKARPTNAQLKKQCATEYTTLRDQALGLLIASQWLEGESTDQGIKVTPAEVTKSIDTQRKEQYPKEADFEKALKEAGFTMADLRFQTRLQQLQEKLVAKVSKGAKAPTAQEIAAYYQKNKSQFGSAETRDLHIVLTKDKASAEKAKKAIQSGESWSSVAKKYSTDDASKGQGGKLTVTKGNQEPAFDDAVFAASKGDLIGPIKTQFGYYVVKVDNIKKSTQQTLAQATPSIKSTLTQQGQQKVVSDFSETYRKKWTAKTECRKDYAIQGCKNGPKVTTTAATAATTPAQ